MTNDEPEAMREIHAIRQAMYEETKNMTPQELIAYHKKLAAEHEKKSGIRILKAQKV